MIHKSRGAKYDFLARQKHKKHKKYFPIEQNPTGARVHVCLSGEVADFFLGGISTTGGLFLGVVVFQGRLNSIFGQHRTM